MLNWSDAKTEKEYQLEKLRSRCEYQLRNIMDIRQHAQNISESSLFNLANLRLNELNETIDNLNTQLDLERRKNKLGLICVQGGKETIESPMFNSDFNY